MGLAEYMNTGPTESSLRTDDAVAIKSSQVKNTGTLERFDKVIKDMNPEHQESVAINSLTPDPIEELTNSVNNQISQEECPNQQELASLLMHLEALQSDPENSELGISLTRRFLKNIKEKNPTPEILNRINQKLEQLPKEKQTGSLEEKQSMWKNSVAYFKTEIMLNGLQTSLIDQIEKFKSTLPEEGSEDIKYAILGLYRNQYDKISTDPNQLNFKKDLRELMFPGYKENYSKLKSKLESLNPQGINIEMVNNARADAFSMLEKLNNQGNNPQNPEIPPIDMVSDMLDELAIAELQIIRGNLIPSSNITQLQNDLGIIFNFKDNYNIPLGRVEQFLYGAKVDRLGNLENLKASGEISQEDFERQYRSMLVIGALVDQHREELLRKNTLETRELIQSSIPFDIAFRAYLIDIVGVDVYSKSNTDDMDERGSIKKAISFGIIEEKDIPTLMNNYVKKR